MYKRWKLVLLWLMLGLQGTLAEAHTRLLSTMPADGQQMQAAPRQITLKFAAPVEKHFSEISLAKSPVQRWQVLSTQAKDRTINAVLPKLTPGKYLVRWRVLSRDGHLQRGEFSFEWMAD